MGNQVSIVRTKFIDVRDGDVTFGYRIMDDYGYSYNDLMREQDLHPEDDMKFLEEVFAIAGPAEEKLLDFVIEMCAGVTIDGLYYPFEEIVRSLPKDLQ